VFQILNRQGPHGRQGEDARDVSRKTVCPHPLGVLGALAVDLGHGNQQDAKSLTLRLWR
jgi:hypothetical protein